MTRLALVLTAVALALGTPAAGAPRWSGVTQLSTGDRALGPELALDGAGEGLVVWNQEIGSACPTEPASLSCVHVVQASSRLRDGTWQAPVDISRPGVGSRPTAALSDAGDGAILWVHDIGRDRVVQATYRRGATGTWPEPNDLSESVLEVRDHHIALDRWGNAMAIWAERSATSFVVRGAIRSAQSGVWGQPTILSTPGTNVSAGPSLALAPESLGITAWVEGGQVRASLVYIARWQPVVTVSRPTSTVVGAPSVAVGPNGDSIVVWPARRGSETVVEAALFAYESGTWYAPVELGVLRDASETPRATVDRVGNADVVWVGRRGVESASGQFASTLWTRPVRVSATSEAASGVAVSGDAARRIVAVWEVAGGSVRAALSGVGTTAWQPVGLAAGGSAGPRVALAADGRAVAVWNRNSGQQVTVESAELDGKGPVLYGLVAPSRPVAIGASARFSIRASPWAAPLTGGIARWEFGDGGVASGFEVSHAFAHVGRYTVMFSLADARGDVSTATSVVRVLSRPQNARRPSILGSPRVGATLTCSHGTWAGSPPITFAYRWRRNGTPIPGASSRRYGVVARDTGSRISCAVTATNEVGSRRAVSRAVRP